MFHSFVVISRLKLSWQPTVSKSYGFASQASLCFPLGSLKLLQGSLDWIEENRKEINYNTVLSLWPMADLKSLDFYWLYGLILLLQTYTKWNFWRETWLGYEFSLQTIPHARAVADNYSCQAICQHLRGFLLRSCLLKERENFATPSVENRGLWC